jgi:hypothetical protein
VLAGLRGSIPFSSWRTRQNTTCIVRLIFTSCAVTNIHFAGYRAARVRVIFRLPSRLHHLYSGELAYVEMFNTMSQQPLQPTGLFTTTRLKNPEGSPVCAFVSLSSICMSCHLAPRYTIFRPETHLTLLSDVLQLCETFFFNMFASYFLYKLVRHWSQDGTTGV